MPLQITAQSVKDELERRGYDVDVVVTPSGPILSFEQDGRRRFTLSSSPDLSSTIASVICNDKLAFDHIAKSMDLPVPETETYIDDDLALTFIDKAGSVVVKPADGAHGNGITIGVNEPSALSVALIAAREAYPDSKILLQQQVSGDDYRLLMIDGSLVAAAKRVPASVIGDGVSSIEQLIADENGGDKRTVAYSDRRCKIDETKARAYLGEKRTMIPDKGAAIQVVGTANIGSGGHSEDVTDTIPPAIIELASRLTKSIGAFVCGVDFMHDADSDQWHLIEANTAPSFGLHMNPLIGTPRPVVQHFVDAFLNG